MVCVWSTTVHSTRHLKWSEFSHFSQQHQLWQKYKLESLIASNASVVLGTISSLVSLKQIAHFHKILLSFGHLAPIINCLPLFFICWLINNFEEVYSLTRFAGSRDWSGGIYLCKIKYSHSFIYMCDSVIYW